ncbi:MAG TPA: hypothetical protein VIF38_14395 [Burkholderiales bacterium]|jgi:hypothetical protein
MKRLGLSFLLLLAACGGGPAPADWQLNAVAAMSAFQQDYLVGDTKTADIEFARLKNEISASGRGDLAARAELVRCAARTASLEFDDCPGFAAWRADAGPEELAYYEFLAGRAERAAADAPLSRLVSAGVQFKSGKITPEGISAAIDIASAQGWRRPLLAWLGVQEKRAEAAGDGAALEKIRRRIALVSGKS